MEPKKVAVIWVESCDDCPHACHTKCGYHLTIGKQILEHRKRKTVPDWCALDDPPDF